MTEPKYTVVLSIPFKGPEQVAVFLPDPETGVTYRDIPTYVHCFSGPCECPQCKDER